MKEIRTYVCETCHRKFSDMEACADHERRHIRPVKLYSWAPTAYSNQTPGPKELMYPDRIYVKMSDGRTARYTLLNVIGGEKEGDDDHGKY